MGNAQLLSADYCICSKNSSFCWIPPFHFSGHRRENHCVVLEKNRCPHYVPSNSRQSTVASQLCRSSEPADSVWGTLGNTDPCLTAPSTPTRLLELTSHLYPTCARDSEAQGRKLRPPSTLAETLAQATSWVSHTDVGHLARMQCLTLSILFWESIQSTVLVLTIKTSLGGRESYSLRMFSPETCKDCPK